MYLSFKEDFPCPSVGSTLTYHIDTVYEKGSSDLNEDRFLVGEGLYGVFDGATSLDSQKRLDGKTGGAMAAQIAQETFADAKTNLFEAAVEANRRIRLTQISAGLSVDKRHTLWSTSMAVVRVSGDQIEYCQTGDALIMLLYEDNSHTFLTPELDIDRETMMLWKKLNNSVKNKRDSIYTALNVQIKKVRLQMNREYGVLNGEPEAVDFVQHGSKKLTGVTDILLFTDGLYLPKEDPEQKSDWTTFIDLYQRGGLQGVRDTVRSLQRSDRRLALYPRFKLHDDIAAVAVGINSKIS